MSKKYCHKCQKPIEEGKEIKFSEGTDYYSSRYSSGPRSYITYYLCPKCYQQQQEEMKAKRAKTLKQVGWSLLILVLVLMTMVVIFLFYQYRRDKKLDRITKKSQKK